MQSFTVNSTLSPRAAAALKHSKIARRTSRLLRVPQSVRAPTLAPTSARSSSTPHTHRTRRRQARPPQCREGGPWASSHSSRWQLRPYPCRQLRRVPCPLRPHNRAPAPRGRAPPASSGCKPRNIGGMAGPWAREQIGDRASPVCARCAIRSPRLQRRKGAPPEGSPGRALAGHFRFDRRAASILMACGKGPLPGSNSASARSNCGSSPGLTSHTKLASSSVVPVPR